MADEGPVKMCVRKRSGCWRQHGSCHLGAAESLWVFPLNHPCCHIGATLLFPTVQPDPPVNITVTAVDRNPRWLSVTWQDPPSWNSYFYRLHFELRYRAERSKTFTMWMVNSYFTSGQKSARRYSGSRKGTRKEALGSATPYLRGLG